MEVKSICVLGVGTIGYQIASLAAQNGFNVKLRDISDEIVQEGAKKIKFELKKFHFLKILLCQHQELLLNLLLANQVLLVEDLLRPKHQIFHV